jgi:hypothetical protein
MRLLQRRYPRMIIYFDGPDQTKKSTLMKTASQILGVPMWERAAFLPHHAKNCKLQGNMAFHNPDSFWYVMDELRTIKLFKQLGGNILIDRHPLVSEIVYRRVEGQKSTLEYGMERQDFHNPSEEFVVLCYNGDYDKPISNMYRHVLHEREIDFMALDTSDGEKALEGLVLFLHQVLPTVQVLKFTIK